MRRLPGSRRSASPEWLLTGGEKGKRRGEEEREERREKKRDPGEKEEREREKKIFFSSLGFSEVETRLYSVRIFRKNTKSYRFTPIEFTVIIGALVLHTIGTSRALVRQIKQFFLFT